MGRNLSRRRGRKDYGLLGVNRYNGDIYPGKVLRYDFVRILKGARFVPLILRVAASLSRLYRRGVGGFVASTALGPVL